MKNVRITVMRMACYRDLMERYENPIEHACGMRLGQVFIAADARKPEGFCDSAWESLSPFVTALFRRCWILRPTFKLSMSYSFSLLFFRGPQLNEIAMSKTRK